MLQITPQTLNFLRSAQEAANAKLRRRRARALNRRKLSSSRFDNLVDKSKRILRGGDPTLFEFEGACRAGIRSALCLEGWKWADADENAAKVVRAALSQLGAVRPTWDQGQPEYTSRYGTLRSLCARCGGKIDEDRGSSNGTPVMYCSDLCAHNAMSERKRLSGEKVSLAEYLAMCAASTAKTMNERTTKCSTCGRLFLTITSGRKYCSRACWDNREKIHPDRACEQCGKVFTPKNWGKGVSRYCSRKCASEGRRKVRPALTCVTCEAIFYPKFPSDRRRYCSPACNPYAPRDQRTFICEETKDIGQAGERI